MLKYYVLLFMGLMPYFTAQEPFMLILNGNEISYYYLLHMKTYCIPLMFSFRTKLFLRLVIGGLYLPCCALVKFDLNNSIKIIFACNQADMA